MRQLPSSSMRSLLKIGLILQCLKQANEVQHWRTGFVELLKNTNHSWMDMSPLSSMTEQQRENQYQADMTQFDNERRNRNETAGTRDNWSATHVATHGSLFPFSDNLTTLIFIVASDVNEAKEKDLEVLFLFAKWLLLLIPLIQSKQSLLNYSVGQKARWRVLLSVGADKAAVQVEPSSSKIMLKTNTDYGHWRINWWTRLYGWWKSMFLDMGRQQVCLAIQKVSGSSC